MRDQPAKADLVIARIASRQHGVVSVQQLRNAGLDNFVAVFTPWGGPYEVDFPWRARALIVEVDGFRHHGDRSAFERDRARDAHLQSLGFSAMRFTHRQLTQNRSTVIAALRPLLAERSLAPNL